MRDLSDEGSTQEIDAINRYHQPRQANTNSSLSVQTLFRPEAVDAAAGRSGNALGIRLTSWSLITAFLFSSMIMLVAAALLIKVSRKEQATGWLVPSTRIIQMTAPRSGIIATLDVRDGQEVVKGQPLFTINSQALIQSGRLNVDDAVLSALRNQVNNVITQQSAEGLLHIEETEHLREEISTLAIGLQTVSKERSILEQRVQIGQNRLEALSTLRNSGLISATEFAAREDAVLNLREDLLAMDIAIQNKTGELKTAHYKEIQQEAAFSEISAKLASDRSILQAKILEVSKQAAETITATVSGQVTTVQIRQGEPVAAGLATMIIIPSKSKLDAEFYLPSRAIGFIHEGQSVRLEYDAYPAEEFGSAKGRVLSVAETVSQPAEIRAPVALQQAGYLVRVKLDAEQFRSREHTFQLRPDMVVRASFILEQRTLLGLMLKPFKMNS